MAALASTSCIACSVHGAHCFCRLPEPALRSLETIGTTVHFGPREIVKREGYAADRIFIVCHGRIKLMASSPEGKLLLIRIVGPGDVVGLAAVITDTSYSITAETLTPCELKVVPRAKFLGFMREFPEAGLNTAAAISRGYEVVLLSARRLALSTSAAGKLASTLIDWVRQDHLGTTSDFLMPLTHDELGCMAGLSRETVTRLLGRFRSEGLIRQQGERMSLLQPEKLQALYC